MISSPQPQEPLKIPAIDRNTRWPGRRPYPVGGCVIHSFIVRSRLRQPHILIVR